MSIPEQRGGGVLARPVGDECRERHASGLRLGPLAVAVLLGRQVRGDVRALALDGRAQLGVRLVGQNLFDGFLR